MSLDGFVDHCLELLSPLGRPRARRMFGGHGLYLDDLFIAIISGEQLYLKTDAGTRERFTAAGGQPFTYLRQGHAVAALGFHTAPPEAMESPDGMRPWARLALQAAVAARAQKPAKPAKKTPPRRR
ncbi:MAG: TfoX/Sxy family protein [Rubrivivax sp.]